MAPFVIYADFEAILKSTNEIELLNKHIPCSFAYKLVCSFDKNLSHDVVLYRGTDEKDNVLKQF